MDARRPRRSSPSAAAAVPLLLLLLVITAGSYAAAAGDAGAPVGKTELQQHVEFFDRDKNGIITLSEIMEGLHAVGLGVASAETNGALIMSLVGAKTRPVNATTPFVCIYVENINRGIHRCDTGSYDSEGRFVQAKFDEIFNKYAKTAPDALTQMEVEELRQANRGDNDFEGWKASRLEWGTLYKLGKDKDGFLRKDTARTIYNGSLFYQLERKKESENRT